MFVKDKFDALMQMRNLGINHFPEMICATDDIESVKDFIEENPAEEYCLRDPNGTVGKVNFARSLDEIMEKAKDYDEKFTLVVSANPYKDEIILLGDVKVNKEANHRNIYSEPEINMHLSLDSDELWNVPGFSKLMGYVSNYELYDIVVEFVVYGIRVGKNKENVVVFELRSEY